MGGILKFLSVDEAAVEAVRAGSDLLEICHSAELILRSYESLIREAERSAAFRRLLLTTARETARKQARIYPARKASAPSPAQLNALRTRIERFRDKVAAAAVSPDATSPRAAAPAETS